MAQPSVFGEIPGYPVASSFGSRAEVRLAGLHRHEMNGISGNAAQGADAVVVSGGYVDDRDYGDRIVYTGQGGQEKGVQVKDQELVKGNLALARSEEAGYPVRVIRGEGGDEKHSPETGYRYDGLYVVTEHWQEPSRHGPLIWRYVLERADGGAAWDKPAPPAGTEVPDRVRSVIQRVVRNSKVTQWVKDKHDGVCQFCGIRLETAAGFYAEGAHIRALGAPHQGPDVTSNVLCLCPNDHVLFDKGALYLADGKVHRLSDGVVLYDLRTVAGHDIDWAHADYHREHFSTGA
ncbi:YDG/SRA domain-containing protein [Cellulomonas taurus]|uniref:YDG/SRA domain-containing protein n=1 Tax=Cellulomonas taurus TaxID=2729175 RepID=UPI00145F9A3A|nr:YDG/SRA domain-containing protein [Cellulomonas taurus]